MKNFQILSKNSCEDMLKLLSQQSMLTKYSTADRYDDINENDLLKTTIKVTDTIPDLVVPDMGSNKFDAENAIKIFEYLGKLDRTQAEDFRLWVTLTHIHFWKYSQSRWPFRSGRATYVKEHWFVKGKGLGALRRNAISGLWWSAKLTYAPWEINNELGIFESPDRGKFTKILMSQAQISQDILERTYGSNLALRICLLDALDKRFALQKVTNKDNLTKDIAKKITLTLKHRQIDALCINELNDVVNEIADNSVEQLYS